MPELPEVETIVSDLRKKILAKKIADVEVRLPRIVAGDFSDFKKKLIGAKFKSIGRKGKYIFLEISSVFPAGHNTSSKKAYLLVHLKMTGQLVYKDKYGLVAGGHSDSTDPALVPNRWTRAIFYFSGQGCLFFNDLRTFGYLKIVGPDELGRILSKIGPDPVLEELDINALAQKIKARKTSIKAVLLDQKLLAGLGNIYVDELLFRSGIRPQTPAGRLSLPKIKRILENVNPLLISAIESRGTTFNNYVDGAGKSGSFSQKLQVYGRGGKKCRKCGSIILKTKVAGRGTHFCPRCQG